MPQQIILRKGTAAAWTAAGSVVLAQGEPGFETNTGKLKIGDGTSTWTTLGYVNEDFPTIPANLADLLDVAETAPSLNQVLKWNGTAWAPAADATGGGGTGATTLDELTDVAITGTPSTGQVLSYDGLTWTNSIVPTESLDLTDLRDVNINSGTLASGQVLKYNGLSWSAADDNNSIQTLTGGALPGNGANMTLSSGGGSFKLLPGNANISFAVVGNDITVSTTDRDTTYAFSSYNEAGITGLRLRNTVALTNVDIPFVDTATATTARGVGGSLSINARNTRYTQTLTATASGVDFITEGNVEAFGLGATLATGTNIVTLTTGTTLGLYPGLVCSVTAGTGAFGTNALIVSVDSSTQLTLSINHATAGAVTFSSRYRKNIGLAGTPDLSITNPSGNTITFDTLSKVNTGTVGRIATYTDSGDLRSVQSSNDGLTWDQATRYLVVTSGRLALRQTDFQMLHNSYGTGARSDGLQYAQYFAGVESKAWNIIRGRGTSLVPAASQVGDELFELRAYGSYGTATSDLAVAAQIRFQTTSVNPGFVGSDIVFSVGNGVSAAKSALIIRNTGVVEIDSIRAIGDLPAGAGNGDLVLSGVGTGTVRLPAGTTVGGVGIGTFAFAGTTANATTRAALTPSSGQVYIQLDNLRGYLWDGAAWVDLGLIQGPAGTNGAAGTNGTAATIAVGTVTTGAAGSSATITNAGTSLAATFNFSIPRGDTGVTGAAATIAVGTVTTGAAGSSVAVTNTGTSGAAVFDFTIPAGDDGVDGQTVLNGAVDPTSQGVNGDFYINTVSNEIFGPKTAGAWGAGVSLVGPAGADGADGADGTNGQGVPTGGTTGQILSKIDGTNYNTQWIAAPTVSNSFETIIVAGQTSVVADSATDSLTLAAGTGIAITTNATTDTITIASTVTNTDTTYGISAETATGGVNLRLTGSDSSTDNVKLTAGTNITLTRTSADEITIDAAGGGGTASNSFATIAVAGQTSVAADSATDTLTLVAGTNITITTDGTTDAITINSTASGGAMATRAALSGVTGSLAADGVGPINITGYKSYMLMKVATSAAAWVRIYTSEAARIADASRLEGTDPAPGAGVIAEVITTGAQTVFISPGAMGWNDETVVTTNIPVRVTNKSGATAAITVTLTALQLEA
jgi:hypothetical protein